MVGNVSELLIAGGGRSVVWQPLSAIQALCTTVPLHIKGYACQGSAVKGLGQSILGHFSPYQLIIFRFTGSVSERMTF